MEENVRDSPIEEQEVSKSTEEQEVSKPRNFVSLLYIETTDYNIEEVLKRLDTTFSQYACCLHDRDVEPTGEVKKAHYHLFGKVDNGTSKESIAEKLGIPVRFVQVAKSQKGAVRYLCHRDNPDKYQYDLGDIVSNFDHTKYFKTEISENRQKVIINYIIQNVGVTLEQVILYCIDNGLYSELRRGYSIIRDLVNERRKAYENMLKSKG